MSKDKKDTNITVTIDTKNITINNLESTVIFKDDRGGNEGSENPPNSSNYFSYVDKGKNVVWIGIVNPDSHDPGDSVTLLCVFINPNNKGGDLLKKDAYIADNGSIPATVKENPTKKDDKYPDENYYLVFMVNKANETNPHKIYTIDPKLRIQSG